METVQFDKLCFFKRMCINFANGADIRDEQRFIVMNAPSIDAVMLYVKESIKDMSFETHYRNVLKLQISHERYLHISMSTYGCRELPCIIIVLVSKELK